MVLSCCRCPLPERRRRPRMGERAGQRRQPRTGPRRQLPAGQSRRRADRRGARHPLPRAAERRLDVLLERQPGRAPGRFPHARLRRLALVHDRCAELRGDARLRYPDLHQHPLPAPAQAAADRHRIQSGQLLPQALHRAGRLAGTPGLHPLRWRLLRLLPLGQRHVCRLQRGQQTPRRVQPDEAPQARREHAGR
ncbi:MAG: hypothetical protein BWX70_01068 [Verrucomicrobia bacterium ADurb.Bin070]|nr:MAG: hypothetical protein BWX70_01068 [Verrucomicrobia bacterium ADurb.Bin070]